MTPSSGSNRLDPDQHGSGDTSTTRHDVDHDDPRPSRPERRRSVVEREKEEHGGIKIGSAFFGWLTATGMAVLLTAVLVAAGTAIGLASIEDVDKTIDQATSQAGDQAETIGWIGAVALLVIVFVAYLCGGYVAGRMARFDGLKQGLAVWLWAVLVAVVVAVVAAVAGSEYDVLSRLNSFPRLPVNEGDLGIAGIVAIAAVAAASLVGALLGGLAGMRFHRNVDKTGLGR
ncbi:hypothetical protein [Nocardioides sp. 1609]|uniref:hypothetical protein n=1 Tax=Nocardioides sp. 1609 TaxID=2508327 RepID=UPI001ADB91E7|nr:hypothetical protein [Nocardioides sp. 1609]